MVYLNSGCVFSQLDVYIQSGTMRLKRLFKWYVQGCTYQTIIPLEKERKCSTFGFPQDPVLGQKCLHHVPRDVVSIRENALVCIKHFQEKVMRTYNYHTILMVLHG